MKKRKIVVILFLAMTLIVGISVVVLTILLEYYPESLAFMDPFPPSTPCPASVCTPDIGEHRIAFSSDRAYRGYEIYVMNADGTCVTRLTDFSARHSAKSPRWSPDGSEILFELSYRGGLLSRPDTDMYIVTVDSSRVTRLTRRGGNFIGRWSPDGSRIAFVSDRDGYRALYVMNANGAYQVRLTSAEDGEVATRTRHISWSPDGTRIAFTAASSGREKVYVAHVDGSSLSNLTHDPSANDAFLTWVPDQDRILFKSNRVVDGQEGWWLYIANADGTDRQRLIALDGSSGRLYVEGWASTSMLQLVLSGWRWTHILDIECALDHRPPWNKIDSVPEVCYRKLADPSSLYPRSPSVTLYECSGAPQLTYRVVRGFPEGYAGPPHDNDGIDIVVMNFDGTGITNLTDCSALNVDPNWSP